MKYRITFLSISAYQIEAVPWSSERIDSENCSEEWQAEQCRVWTESHSRRKLVWALNRSLERGKANRWACRREGSRRNDKQWTALAGVGKEAGRTAGRGWRRNEQMPRVNVKEGGRTGRLNGTLNGTKRARWPNRIRQAIWANKISVYRARTARAFLGTARPICRWPDKYWPKHSLTEPTLNNGLETYRAFFFQFHIFYFLSWLVFWLVYEGW